MRSTAGWRSSIMPVFALANAGVTFGEARFGADGATVLLGVTLGLVVGKPVGVICFVVAGGAREASRRCRRACGGRALLVVGLVAGIGFTMAIFVATLALPPGPLIEVAKLGILRGVRRRQRDRPDRGPPAASDHDAPRRPPARWKRRNGRRPPDPGQRPRLQIGSVAAPDPASCSGAAPAERGGQAPVLVRRMLHDGVSLSAHGAFR